MLALVAAGLGVAMVPGLATTAGAAPGVVLVDPRPALERRIFAAVRPGSGRRAAVAAVLAALTARADELGGQAAAGHRYLWQERAFFACTTA